MITAKLRLIFILIFIIGQVGYASEISWPKNIYTINSVNDSFFFKLTSYFKQVKQKYPIRYEANGFDILSRDGGNRILRARFEESSDGLALVYQAKGKSSYIVLKGHTPGKEFDYLFFDFSSILRNQNFTIDFRSLGTRISLEKISGKRELVYSYDWGNIYFHEWYEPDLLKSRIWFQCGSCSGESLSFIYKKESIGFTSIYRVGKLQNEVATKRFFEVANKWYLSSFNRHSGSTLKKLKHRFNWPQEK